MALCAGFEPAIFAVKRRHPEPLDEQSKKVRGKGSNLRPPGYSIPLKALNEPGKLPLLHPAIILYVFFQIM